MMRLALLIVAVGTTNALLVGSPARVQTRRASSVKAGLFDKLAAAFANDDFDDRSAQAQHILFKGGDEDERAVAAEAIKGKIEAGEMTFEAAAQQFSECSSRAQSPAGSLGQFQPGKMVPEFDEYIFNPASPIGEIAIVDTKFGTHLVKINERNEKWVDGPGKTKTDGGWSF